jgi:hypothetical protein
MFPFLVFTIFTVNVPSATATVNASPPQLLKYEHLWEEAGKESWMVEWDSLFTFLYFSVQWSPGKGYLERRRRQPPEGINYPYCTAILRSCHCQNEVVESQ